MRVSIGLGENFSRRAFLLGPATLAACGRRKGTGFPGYAIIASQEGRSLAAVDLTSFSVRRRIALDASPSAVIAHPTEPLVYVLAPQNGSVYEVEATRMERKRSLRLGETAVGMRMAGDGESLWVLRAGPHALVRVPLKSFQPAEQIRLSGPPTHFDLSRDGRAAILLPQEGQVAFATLAPARIVRRAPVEGTSSFLGFRADGKQLLVASASRSVSILDALTGETIVRLPLPIEPHNACFTPDGGQLFLTGAGMDAVVIVYPYWTEVAETILAGGAPGAMVAAASPPYLFVANPRSGTVTVLDIDFRKLIAVIRVGEEPGQITITPDGQYALVLNRSSGDLAVIRIATLAERRYYKIAPLFTMIPVGPRPVSTAIVRV